MEKLIFIDVDGTLVDYEGNLPKSAALAIQKARQNGHKVILSTGRSKAEIYDEIWAVGLDGLIGANGAYVEYHDTVLLHQCLTKELVAQLLAWLEQRNCSYYAECNSGLFASKTFETDGANAILAYSQSKGMSGMTVRQAFPHMIFGESCLREDVNKISFVLGSYQDYLDAKKAFPSLTVRTWGGKGETALFGDFGLKDIEKSTAIEAILTHLHKTPGDTIAIGDAAVDIPMLTYCDIGIAMGNGGEEIRAMADYVTDDVTDDGLSHAFAHFGLI